MAGAYCRYCDRRCFVLRELPDGATIRGARQVHLATCAAGAEHDRTALGVDHTTARNPQAA